MIAEPLRSLIVPIDSLNLDPANARLHPERNLDAIKGSLSRFGQRKPIIVRANGRIVMAGNGLLTAAKALGWTEIAAVILDDDAITATAYALADNRTAELAEWDDEVLPRLMDELIQAGEHPANMGWDDGEIAALLNQEKPDIDAPARIDEAEALREKWGVERGQIWTLGKHRIMCGDATNAEDVAALFGGESPSLMVTDPPYGVNYDPAWRIILGPLDDGRVHNDDIVDWSKALGLFEGDVMYVWHAGKMAAEVQAGIESLGFQIRNQIIWSKPHFPISRGDYHWRHEPLWYAVRKGHPSNWGGDRTQSTIWEIPLDEDAPGNHSTQKPVECMARPMRNHTFVDIYDPFVGSGTSIIAAEQLTMNCFAMEISPAYVAVAIQRWADATGGSPLKVEVPQKQGIV